MQKEKIKILVGAVGAPGSSTLVRHLKENGERQAEIIGIDADDEVYGAFVSDTFYRVPMADRETELAEKILDIVAKEKPDVFYPVSSVEVPVVCKIASQIRDMGTAVCVSSCSSIALAENKYELYKLMHEHSIPAPEYYSPKNLDEFVKLAGELGYPERQVCFKPHVSKGSRGFRVIDDHISRKDLLLNYKPEARYMSMNEFIEIFEKEETFPDFLLMEVMTGEEHDAMGLGLDGVNYLTTVKSREKNRWGVITLGELLDRPDIEEKVDTIYNLIGLSYNVSMQFIGGKLLEINPRPSTFIYQADLNEPYLAVKIALGEIDEAGVRSARGNIRFGTRMIRYMDQIFYPAKGSREFYT